MAKPVKSLPRVLSHAVELLQLQVPHNYSSCSFSLPPARCGKRWLRQKIFGRENSLEVELVEGQGYPGQKRWTVKFSGYNSIDEAKPLVGATILVRESDRPELEEGEIYSRDLVGMRIILKEKPFRISKNYSSKGCNFRSHETSKPVGTVVNVFNHGANDLLSVMLDSPQELPNGSSKEKQETDGSGALVWIPFVEAIVPDVDMAGREMWITPPKGLLELNIRSDGCSKKERCLLEWKERKQFQRRLIAVKKKLCDIEQKHAFHGLRYGDKTQRSLLADQIVTLNSKLLEQALQNLEISSMRSGQAEINNLISTRITESSLKISDECLVSLSKGELSEYSEFRENGLELVSKNKLAVVLLLNCGKWRSSLVLDCDTTCGDEKGSAISLLEKLLSGGQEFIQR